MFDVYLYGYFRITPWVVCPFGLVGQAMRLVPGFIIMDVHEYGVALLGHG